MDCAIFDIDGTLADSRHRDHLRPRDPAGDWSRFKNPALVAQDRPIALSWSILRSLAESMPIHFVSGRHEAQRGVTADWLRQHGDGLDLVLDHTRLHLRPNESRMKSVALKRAILGHIRARGFRPVFAAEDNSEDAGMYARAGLSVLFCKAR